MSGGERLLDLIAYLPDDMLAEAVTAQGTQGGKWKKVVWGVAAAACILLLFLRFVPAGQAMAAQLYESMERLWEELFPPKEITLAPEGLEEQIVHEAGGSLPEQVPGFAIYYDTDRYEMKEEENGWVIRPQTVPVDNEETQAFYNSLPVCEIRIVQLPESSLWEAAASLPLRHAILQRPRKGTEQDSAP